MSKTPDYFAGKTIIITGAASGIGRATALIFAREGANVVCADINEKGAGETAAEVKRKGSGALALEVDVTKRTEVDDMAEARARSFRPRPVSVQLGRRRHPPRQISRDRRCADGENLRAERHRHALLHASVAAAHARRKARRHRQYGEHGAPPWGPGSSIHYAAAKGAVVSMTLGRCSRIRHARHPRAVDLARTDQHALSGRGAILARADQAIPRRYADAALRRTRGDRRTGSVHLLRRLRIHDRGHGLCERRRWMALIEVWCRLTTNNSP